MIVDVNTELRKLRPAELYNLGLILNPSDNWKKLMASVTKEGTDDVPKFSGEYIAIVEQAARQERKLAAAIFLEEWGTMGRKRPSVGLLLNLLMKAELFRAADYLAQDVLKIETPRRPTFGPAAPVDIDSIAELLQQRNLNDESASNDSNFCQRTTSEIPLSQINYPMFIFDSEPITDDNNLAVNDNDVGVFEMQYAESRSNQVLDHARVYRSPESSDDFEKRMINQKNTVTSESSNAVKISDLMKFSASGQSGQINRNGSDEGYSRSDLIKFVSETEHSNENVELHEAIFPDLNVLYPAASTKSGQGSPANDQGRVKRGSDCPDVKTDDRKVLNNREMSSTELPACLGNFGASKESPTSIGGTHLGANASYFHRELRSAELPLCINDRTGFNSSESNINDNNETVNSEYSSRGNSAIVSAQSLDSETSKSDEVSVKNESMKRSVSETELPCFVVEAGMRKRNERNDEAAVGNNGANNVLNSREFPVTVLEFNKR